MICGQTIIEGQEDEYHIVSILQHGAGMISRLLAMAYILAIRFGDASPPP